MVHERGEFHKLLPELQASLVQTGKEMATKWEKNYDVALKRQKAATRRRREIIFEKKLEEAEDDYIVAIYFHEQYNSKRCWDNVEKAKDVYRRLKSESTILAAVKEQILIRYLGLGWTDAHHPWLLKEEGTFSSKRLFKLLVDTVIPMADTRLTPDEPPVTMPTPPKMHKLGTTSKLAENLKSGNTDKQ